MKKLLEEENYCKTSLLNHNQKLIDKNALLEKD